MSGVKEDVTIHWFRHGLRLHDNPALLHAVETSKIIYHVFIFDGEVAGIAVMHLKDNFK